MSIDAKDDTSTTEMDSRASTSAPAELRVRRWGVIGLVLLTTVAVGSISLWLVPPYWLIMAWLLAPPGGWRRPPEPSAVPEADAPASALPEAEAPVPEEPSPPETPEKPAKPARRKRSRAKKKAQEETLAPNVEATWVRVGPNQFVRVEVPVEPEPDPAPAESTAAEPADVDHDPPAAKPDERRFDVATWRARSWRPERGVPLMESGRRPWAGVRCLPTVAGGLARDPYRNGGEFRDEALVA